MNETTVLLWAIPVGAIVVALALVAWTNFSLGRRK